MNARIVFLDDDPVIRIARYVLLNAEDDASLADFFSPEVADFAGVRAAALGISRKDGADVELAHGPVSNADIVILRRGQVSRDFFKANPALRLIVKLGEQLGDIDLDAARDAGCAVSSVPRLTLDYTAEHALLLMQALGKRLLRADGLVRRGGYDASLVHPIDDVAYNWAGIQRLSGLAGHTLGIVGLGEVGLRVARLAKAFGMHVLYTKRQRLPRADEIARGIEYAPLEHLLGRADYVSLHVANTPANDKLMGREAFDAMKASAYFVNTSRGRMVDEDALYKALLEGRIAGAGLDTHRVEPRPVHDRFSELDNVVLTPHIAGGSRTGVLLEIETILRHVRAALVPATGSSQLSPGDAKQ